MNIPPDREVALFNAALQRPVGERAAFLERECGGDNLLRRKIEELLRVHDEVGNFLENPTQTIASPAEPAAGPSGTVRLDPALIEKTGERIGPYKLLQQIGEGGCGVVYMAEQTQPVRRKVALKVIKLGMDTKNVIARFEAERQALALMDHPNIAKVLDAGATDTGRPFFVMELVKGVRITDYCDQNNLPTKDRLNLFTQVCHAIQHAHQKGIIHRDIKPSNILVTLHDGVPVPKVIDFGIAKATTDQPLTDKTLFTAFEQFIGTPAYMSPEQAEMTGLDIDTRTDVYALGVLLYELLTGRTPFDPKALVASGIEAMRRTIREQEPERPSTALSTMLEADLTHVASQRQSDSIRLVNLVRGDLDWIVMKALEKDRTRRYETANGLAMEVQRYLANEPVTARPPSQIYRLQKLVRRNKLAFAAAAAVTATLVVGVALTVWQAVRATHEQRIAALARDRAVQAETEAQQQKLKAQSEAHSAAVQLADSLINQGDALTTATEYPPAYARYAEAAEQLQKLGNPLARLDLSLVRLYRASPPPLWTATIPGYLDGMVPLPSRKEIIVACGDGKFYALDQLTGTTLRSFGNAGGVHHLAIASSTNGPVVIASGVGFVRMIDPATGFVLRSASDDRAAEFCVASPDGTLVASGGLDGAVSLWETASFETVAGWTPGTKGHCAAFSHDGKIVATLNDVISLWDVKTGQPLRRVPAPPSSRIAFTADDRALLCGENGGFISLTSVEGGNSGRWLAYRSNMGIRSLVATPEGNRVLTASSDGEVRLFDNSFGGAWNPTLTMDTMNQGQIFDALYLPDTGPKACAAATGISPADQGVVISGTERGYITAWPLVAPDRFQDRLERAISISPDGLLCAGQVSGRVEVRDVATGRTLRVLPQPFEGRATAFSRDGTQLYIGGNDGTLRAFDILRGEYLWSVHAHNDLISSIDVALEGAIVGSASSDGTTRAWDSRTGALLGSVHHQGGYGTAAIFVPAAEVTNAAPTTGGISAGNQRMVIGGGDGGAIYEWDVFGNRKPRHLYGPGPIRGLALSPDHKLVAAVSAAHSATLFNPATFEKAGFLGPIRSAMYQVCFIDPGNSLGAWALASGGRELRVFEMSTRREILTLDSTFDDRATSTSDTGTYAINTLAASGDGTIAMAKGTGRINFALPRLYRELARAPSPVRLAEIYAEWGVWAWTRDLLDRERAAGHDCPPLLRARADWMCGDYAAARAGFDLAVARHEAPGWYAALCASVSDAPPSVAPPPPTARPPDPFEQLPAATPLPDGVLAAAEMPLLKTMIGKEVLVEGVVTDTAWSRSGKVMNIHFASGVEERAGLLCCVFLKDRPKFDTAFAGDAAGAFAGSRLRVRGTLARYGGFEEALKGTAQIILTDPRQVTIVEQHPSSGYLPVPLAASSIQIRDSDSARDRAAVLAEQGKFAEAEPLLREAIALRSKALGKDDRARDQLLASLAGVLEAEGKLPEAETARREELAIESKLSGEEHAYVANSLVNLATVLRKEQKFAEAEKCDREALAMRRKLLGNEHSDVVTLLAQVASALLEEQRFAEAEPMARECLTLREKITADDWRTFNMRSVLGGSLLGQKKYAEAEPLLLSGCEGLIKREDKITVNGKPRLNEAHQRLVQLYEATGQPERAAEWKKKLAAIEQARSSAKATASRQ